MRVIIGSRSWSSTTENLILGATKISLPDLPNAVALIRKNKVALVLFSTLPHVPNFSRIVEQKYKRVTVMSVASIEQVDVIPDSYVTGLLSLAEKVQISQTRGY